MKNINVQLTDNEYKALQDLIWMRTKCCESGCIWKECEESSSKIVDEDKRYYYCYRCEFTKAATGLEKKLLKEDTHG